jgi:hypothetical protein
MVMLEFILIRRYFKDTYTIGKIFTDQIPICDTLEDRVRELHDINHDNDFDDSGEGKIYGQTAIPCGRYRIIMVYWRKHDRMAPMLLDVPGFKGILIHRGATDKDTEGCILVGENKIKGGLINSKYHVAQIEEMINEALSEKKEVWITIKQ